MKKNTFQEQTPIATNWRRRVSSLSLLAVLGMLLGASDSFAQGKKKKMETPPAPGKPLITRLEPRGVQRGLTATIKLTGTNLAGITNISFTSTNLSATLLPGQTATQLSFTVTPPASFTRGAYEFSVSGTAGESGRAKLFADDLPQISEWDTVGSLRTLITPPVSVWGAIEKPGETDEYELQAKANQLLVLDLEAETLGSKATNVMLTVLDARGTVLATSRSLDGAGDPLLAFKAPSSGHYRLKVGDLMLGASKDNFYRLTVGALPFVTGVHPMSIPANRTTEVELVGYNLPANRRVSLAAKAPGELDVPLDPERFRSRSRFKVLVGDETELIEAEPNDQAKTAMRISAPGAVSARIWPTEKGQTADVDLYRFSAKTRHTWVIEAVAARRGSPVDTRIEVLDSEGRPVPRLLLQAVRDSRINFRSIDSNGSDVRVDNWEEMELNQLLYLQGDVAKLFRAPQGPDSGFLLYSIGGKRQAFFDTSPTAHSLDEPCYIVEPHAPGTKLSANGLPVFTLDYANDDDGERKLGRDSKLFFTAPADGDYLIRVTDSRGFNGDRYVYRLVIREPKPDFSVTFNNASPSVNRGSGQEFSVTADRADGFEGEIRLEVSGLPDGFIASNPLVIQAGHRETKGTIFAAMDAVAPAENHPMAKATATATINGKSVTKTINGFSKLKLADKPKLFVSLLPPGNAEPVALATNTTFKPLEITIAPGQTVPAHIKVRRNGHDDLITFTVDNLPHGVIVADIGLNGVLIPKDESEREIFLTAAKWVPETDRLCHALENNAGKQTSLPVLLHVRRSAGGVASGAGHESDTSSRPAKTP